MELRDRILKAADQVIRTNGLSRTTTKEIARIAGCSEGSLYNHFQSKEDLFLHVMKGMLPGFIAILIKLHSRKGTGTVKDNLEEVANAAIDFFNISTTMFASMFSEPKLMARHREGFQLRNEGPHRTNEVVAAYLLAEQNLGRVRANVDPRSAADLLLGACFQHAFHLQMLDMDESAASKKKFVEDVLQTLMQGILT
jgi:AcrR family transcriptional regulator